jgi:hypothetical protein
MALKNFEVPKPPLAIRIGITGHLLKKLDSRQLPELSVRSHDALHTIATAIRELATQARVRNLYELGANGLPVLRLRLLSPLAEGADRIVAEQALALGYHLEAPLPFAQGAYEED